MVGSHNGGSEEVRVYKSKRKRWEIVRLVWGLLWTLPLFASMLLLIIVARVGFGKSIANEAARDFLR